MMVGLKGMVVCKGIETAESCMSMATTNSALRWNFKNSAKANQRMCALMSIKFGPKKGWVSGQRVGSCGYDPIAMTEVIMADTQSVLKTLAVKKKVKNANICSDACTADATCQYYKWMAKKKTCFLLALDYVPKTGMSTS